MATLDFIPASRIAFLAAASVVLYSLCFGVLVAYRLFWSPLSKFPGPKLAAATYLYEGYYDVIKRGKYTFKIRDLHAQYGQSYPVTLANVKY